MRLYQMADAVRYEMMNTEELRETFLLEGMFEPGEIEFAYVDLDRTVIGSAVPESEALTLETEPELRAEYFLERRELGVFNVGRPGSVVGDRHPGHGRRAGGGSAASCSERGDGATDSRQAAARTTAAMHAASTAHIQIAPLSLPVPIPWRRATGQQA